MDKPNTNLKAVPGSRSRQNDLWEEYIEKRSRLKVRKARFIKELDASGVWTGHYIPDPEFSGPDDAAHGTYWNEVVLMRPKTITDEHGNVKVVGVGKTANERITYQDDPNTPEKEACSYVIDDRLANHGHTPTNYKVYQVLPPTKLDITDHEVGLTAPVIPGYPEYTEAYSVATDRETGEVKKFPAEVTTKKHLMSRLAKSVNVPDTVQDTDLVVYTEMDNLEEGHEYMATAVIVNPAGNGLMDDIDLTTCSMYEVGRTRIIDTQETAVSLETTILKGKPKYYTKSATLNKGTKYDPSSRLNDPMVYDWTRSASEKGFLSVPHKLEPATWYFIRLEVLNAYGLYISPGRAFRTKGGGDAWELADPSVYEITDHSAEIVGPYYRGKDKETKLTLQIRKAESTLPWQDVKTRVLPLELDASVDELEPSTLYQVRSICTTELGLRYESPITEFKTKGRPAPIDWEIGFPSVGKITSDQAHVEIPFKKGEAEFIHMHINYVKDGETLPVEVEPVILEDRMEADLEGLLPDTKYHVMGLIEFKDSDLQSDWATFKTKQEEEHRMDLKSVEVNYADTTIDVEGEINFTPVAPYDHVTGILSWINPTTGKEENEDVKRFDMEGAVGHVSLKYLGSGTHHLQVSIIEGRGVQPTILAETDVVVDADHRLYIDDVQVNVLEGKYQALLEGHSNFTEFQNLTCEWYEGTVEGEQKFLKLTSGTFDPSTLRIKGDYIYPFEEGKTYCVRLDAFDKTTRQNVYSNWVEFKGRYVPFVEVDNCEFVPYESNFDPDAEGLVRIKGLAKSNLWLWSNATASVYMWYKEKWMCLGNYGNCEFDQETGDITFQTIPFTPVGVKFYVQLDVNLSDGRSISAEPFYFEYSPTKEWSISKARYYQEQDIYQCYAYPPDGKTDQRIQGYFVVEDSNGNQTKYMPTVAFDSEKYMLSMVGKYIPNTVNGKVRFEIVTEELEQYAADEWL